MYVTEFNNGIITKITSNGVSTFSSSLSIPAGIAIDSSDNIYVSDNHRVVSFTFNGTMSVLAGYRYWVSGYADGYGNAVLFKNPRSLAVGSDGHLYVADVYPQS